MTVLPSKIAAPGVNILPAILLPLAGPEELDLEVSLKPRFAWRQERGKGGGGGLGGVRKMWLQIELTAR